jgi:hypothetical protein
MTIGEDDHNDEQVAWWRGRPREQMTTTVNVVTAESGRCGGAAPTMVSGTGTRQRLRREGEEIERMNHFRVINDIGW